MAEEADKISLNWLDRGMEVICKIVLCITCTAMFAILLANVVLRYTSGSSLAWAGEVPELLFPWFVDGRASCSRPSTTRTSISASSSTRSGPASPSPLAVLRTVVSPAPTPCWSDVAYDLLPIVADERSPILACRAPSPIPACCSGSSWS